MTRPSITTWTWMLLGCLVWIAASGVAFAMPDAAPSGALRERVEAHEDQVAEHRRDSRPDILSADIRIALELYAAADGAEDTDAIRKRIVKTVGQLTKRGNDIGVRMEAIRALGDLGHEDG